MRRLGAVSLVAAMLVAGHPVASSPAPQSPPVTELLDRYLAGRFDAVIESLSAMESFDGLLSELKAGGAAWVDAATGDEARRRELAAATVALEAARLGEPKEWSDKQRLGAGGGYQYRITFWEPPAQLIEWGCELLRRSDQPAPAERWWQLAANAVSERAEDDEFLYGDVAFPGRYPPTTMISPTIKIEHLRHVRKRFPKEPRFALAEPIALEWVPTARDLATKMFRELQDDVDVGGEASLRVGAMALRQGRGDEALVSFGRVEALTRDPWVVYLARYLSGRVWEGKGRMAEAERSYRGALAVFPRAQSVAVSLGALLFRQGQRQAAAAIVERMIEASPPPDPWRDYTAADFRFWPELRARLRAEITR